MSTPDEIAAAAERLRRVRAGEHVETVYPIHEFAVPLWAYDNDRNILADAYLAEHATETLKLGVLQRKDVLGEPQIGFYDDACLWRVLGGEVSYNHAGVTVLQRGGGRMERVATLGQLRRILSVIREQEAPHA